MGVACYFDFTCGYSYRIWSWFQHLYGLDPSLEITWLPFVLKEVNRNESEPSFLAGPTIDSVAVLGLAAAEALRGHPGVHGFRSDLFVAMHAGDQRPGRDEVIAIAARAGLDFDAFFREEASWIQKVRASHDGAVERWGVFGTPTLVIEDAAALYVKLTQVPPEDDLSLFETLTSLALDSPEVVELKRPSVPN